MNTNKNVVVTGVSGALGAATSAKLKSAGWNIIGIDRQPSATCKVVLADLADASQIRTSFQSIINDHGDLHALVNNAGVFLGRSWDEVTDDETSLTLDVNLRAPLLLSTLFAKNAIARGLRASIVNVASIAGREPGHDIVYAASKAALIQVTRGLGRQLAGQGIRVNAVAPGVIEGPMADQIPEPGRSAYRRHTPMQRFADPAEIASVISFLLSPDASYITGAVIDANGGLF